MRGFLPSLMVEFHPEGSAITGAILSSFTFAILQWYLNNHICT